MNLYVDDVGTPNLVPINFEHLQEELWSIVITSPIELLVYRATSFAWEKMYSLRWIRGDHPLIGSHVADLKIIVHWRSTSESDSGWMQFDRLHGSIR